MSNAMSNTRPVAPAPRIDLRSESAAAIVVFAALALLPLMMGGYVIYVLPQYLIYGVLAMSLGMLWGYAGILSFGQAAFFALGAYAMGLAMKASFGASDGYLGLLAAIVIGAGLAFLVGYFLFSAGVRDIYFVLITLALSIMVQQIAISQSSLTGGFNGMYIPRMDLALGPFGSVSLAHDRAIYYLVLPVTIAIYAGLRRLTRSDFGKVLVGIRENEGRTLSLGFETSWYKTIAFTISGAVACLAGALYGAHAEFVSPSLASVAFSTEVVIWVAIGGRQSLLGALLGGLGVAALSNYLDGLSPVFWQLILGGIFVAVIIAFKGGIAGALGRLVARKDGTHG
jgi:urea ABC transporter permease protein UrtC